MTILEIQSLEGLAMYLAGDIDSLTSPDNLENFLNFYNQDMSSTGVYEEAGFAVKNLIENYGKEKLLLLLKVLKEVGLMSSLVGVTGLEPATSRTPCVRASQLRHTPTIR